MRFGFNGVSYSNSVPTKGTSPHKNPARSWTVYVFDSQRTAPPHNWPVVVTRSEVDARMVLAHLKEKYAGTKNLCFYLEPSEGDPREIMQYFEKKFGSCPESLRLEVPQASLKMGA